MVNDILRSYLDIFNSFEFLAMRANPTIANFFANFSSTADEDLIEAVRRMSEQDAHRIKNAD
jgi:hypothetical protein